jgi:hypothetical protein
MRRRQIGRFDFRGHTHYVWIVYPDAGSSPRFEVRQSAGGVIGISFSGKISAAATRDYADEFVIDPAIFTETQVGFVEALRESAIFRDTGRRVCVEIDGGNEAAPVWRYVRPEGMGAARDFFLDVGLIDVGRLVRRLLPFRWQRECVILDGRKPDSSVCAVLVKHIPTGLFLRCSQGPQQGYFWDGYGDHLLDPELALVAISQAPDPSSTPILSD